ncbi:hypothetical protein H6P81_004242 [Aristolochia fimbriata]|uniref:Transmembrane protein n=1 Tax=Aristolochia fimbriata TaxID=158543 RepID=A0AAV7FFC9_ARIFI|nr:hypothetical protein H6P81_004242 [Aristolochia fimbriata]
MIKPEKKGFIGISIPSACFLSHARFLSPCPFSFPVPVSFLRARFLSPCPFPFSVPVFFPRAFSFANFPALLLRLLPALSNLQCLRATTKLPETTKAHQQQTPNTGDKQHRWKGSSRFRVENAKKIDFWSSVLSLRESIRVTTVRWKESGTRHGFGAGTGFAPKTRLDPLNTYISSSLKAFLARIRRGFTKSILNRLQIGAKSTPNQPNRLQIIQIDSKSTPNQVSSCMSSPLRHLQFSQLPRRGTELMFFTCLGTRREQKNSLNIISLMPGIIPLNGTEKN